MNEQSAESKPIRSVRRGIIGQWLAPMLMLALMGNVGLSAILIIRLSQSEEAERHAVEAAREAVVIRGEVSSLQIELDSLTKQKDILAPTIANWQNRLKEQVTADAARFASEEKQRQLDRALAEGGEQMKALEIKIGEAEKKKAGLEDSITALSAQASTIEKSIVDAVAERDMATKAEERRRKAMNDADTAVIRLKQLEDDKKVAQMDFDNTLKTAEVLRAEKVALTKDKGDLQQQLTDLKTELDGLAEAQGNLKKIQADTQIEEQKLAKLVMQIAVTTAGVEDLDKRKEAANAELANLNERIRDASTKSGKAAAERATNEQAASMAADELTKAKKLLAETKASHAQVTQDHATIVAEKEVITKGLVQVRAEAASLDVQVAKAKADLLKAVAQAKAAQELTAEEAQLVRDVATHTAERDDLKNEKKKLEKEIGELKAKLPKPEPAPETPSDPTSK